MLATIEFHDQTAFETDEVDDVGPDRCLPAKPASVELAMTQMMPQASLGIGHILAEVPRKVAAHVDTPTPALPHKGLTDRHFFAAGGDGRPWICIGEELEPFPPGADP